MDLPAFRFGSVRLPAPAGDLLAQGYTAAFVSEVGQNYARYHSFLADALAATGGRPDPRKYPDPAEFGEAAARVQDILLAEKQIRLCWAAVQPDRAAARGTADDTPLVTRGHALHPVGAEDASMAKSWIPPGEPPWWGASS